MSQKRGDNGGRELSVISAVIRLKNDSVLVFDAGGEQVPEYQGQYEEVKEVILKDAPPTAVFVCLLDSGSELQEVLKKEW